MTFKLLQSRSRTAIRTEFIAAVRETRDRLQEADPIPFDTGRLQSKIVVGGSIFVTGDELSATIRSEATSDRGFDYPAYLNSRSRRYLNAMTVSGSTSTHLRWWERALGVIGGGDNLWDEVLKERFDNLVVE